MKLVIVTGLLILSCHAALGVDFSLADPVISDLEITVPASLSAAASNYYLQGTLRAVDSSKYFGETYNGKGSWIDYLSSPEKEFIIGNFLLAEVQNSSWSGTVKVRYKADDPTYKGPGQYELKLRRFTGGSSSTAGESNTVIVTLSAPLPAPSAIPDPSPSPSLDPSPLPSLVPPPSVSSSPPVVLSPSPSGTIAGETVIDLSAFGATSPPPIPTPSPPAGMSLNREHAQVAILIGSGLIITSVAGGIMVYRRRPTSTHLS